jgi:hypothetical protein
LVTVACVPFLVDHKDIVAVVDFHNHGITKIKIKIKIEIEIKILGSECQTIGTYAKRSKQATNKDNAAACLCFSTTPTGAN